ncbi:hypothetical protein HOP50_20g85200 [Chloropicon primus]|uniref:RWP-RK domain-containing protein n=1 Tax=Chloropicon primus TaxID=1764295 RepID=A0A5B8MZP6_9CHLO|nr:hypothetical protein A3770_20p84870 [Chloropicon primus]UPR05170.1 hypothetical protein HOP50_20g85200 [Chloropicon primus]|eukprot:QDZ25969.1 hypothetical protein A3770_20p84870 [Chloropicon primus]
MVSVAKESRLVGVSLEKPVRPLAEANVHGPHSTHWAQRSSLVRIDCLVKNKALCHENLLLPLAYPGTREGVQQKARGNRSGLKSFYKQKKLTLVTRVKRESIDIDEPQVKVEQSTRTMTHYPLTSGGTHHMDCFKQVKDISFDAITGFGPDAARAATDPVVPHCFKQSYGRGRGLGVVPPIEMKVTGGMAEGQGSPLYTHSQGSDHSAGSFAYWDKVIERYPPVPLGMHVSTGAGTMDVQVKRDIGVADGYKAKPDAFDAIPDMGTLDFLLSDDGDSSLLNLNSPRFNEALEAAGHCEHGEGNCAMACDGSDSCILDQEGMDLSDPHLASDLREEQMKALEWLFSGKSCDCTPQSLQEKVRGKVIKDLPCCKCLMKIFMTVLDAKKASKECGMSPTTFKKRLRKIGIKTYPSRKIRCLFKCIQSKNLALTTASDDLQKGRIHDDLAKCREELRMFKEKLEQVLACKDNPKAQAANLTLCFSGRFKRIRNRIHKTNYKKKRGLGAA